MTWGECTRLERFNTRAERQPPARAHKTSAHRRIRPSKSFDLNWSLAMVSSTKIRANWLLPAALLVLSAVPVAFGVVRLVELALGAEITPENARFFAAPVPIALHALSAILFCVLGAFQFAPGFRRRMPSWHRAAGRLLI